MDLLKHVASLLNRYSKLKRQFILLDNFKQNSDPIEFEMFQDEYYLTEAKLKHTKALLLDFSDLSKLL